MRFEVFRPEGWLGSFVDHYWKVVVAAKEYPFYQEALLPDGGVTVLFNLGDAQSLIEENGCTHEYERSWVSGERTRAITLGSPGSTNLVGIRFKSGGARPFFDVPIRELTDRVVDLALFWPATAEVTRARLAEAPTIVATAAVLDEALSVEARRRVAEPSVAHALRMLGAFTDDGLTVSTLASDLGLSQRTLLRHFGEWVGFGPKMLQRLFRFQKVLKVEAREPAATWADIAQVCGYYDQSRLINEFREFSGVTPTEYRRCRGIPGYIPRKSRTGSIDSDLLANLRDELPGANLLLE